MQTRTVAAIIDNDAETAADLAAVLRGLRVDVAISATHSIKSSESVRECEPEIVFVSVEAPVLRAEKTIEFVHSSLPRTAIVAYASSGDLRLARRAMQAGARSFIRSPLTLPDVRQVIKPALTAPAGRSKVQKSPGGLVLTVIGQKGGIGKTTIATNLAVALASENYGSTLIIDLDTRFGDVAVMLDLDPGMRGDAWAGSEQDLDREWFRGACVEHPSGLHVLPAPTPHQQSLASTPQGVQRLVKAAVRFFDYVVLDTPGTFNEVIGAGIECADKVVAVTSPELASLKNTRVLMEHLGLSNVPIEDVLVILNHTMAAVTASAAEVAKALGREISWEVPHDRAIRMANQAGRQVVVEAPKSPSARSITNLAAVVAGAEAALARQTVAAIVPERVHRWRPRPHIHRLMRTLPFAFRF